MFGGEEPMRRNFILTPASPRPDVHAAMSSMQNRHGWMLPEIVVVAGVIGVVGIVCWLVWISSMQQARREGTKENLRKMGVGVKVYYDSWRSFPMTSQSSRMPVIPEVEVPQSTTDREPADTAEESIWFESETGELKRGWCALLAASGAALVALISIVGFGMTHLKS